MSATLFTVQCALNETCCGGNAGKESLTCACYTSGCQKLEGSCAAQPAVMLILQMVVLFEQVVVVVVIIIVAIVYMVRSCIVVH
jgi:hypothetical protein